jgi:hypothetical protein
MSSQRCLTIVLALVMMPALSGLAFAAPARADAAWYGEYFNNTTLSGGPAMVRYDNAIDFDWGAGSPDPAVSADNFSVRWTRTVRLDWTGNYRFYSYSDDGMRVWVDNLLVIDDWRDKPASWVTADVYLATGEHLVKVEYYERAGQAVAKLVYQPEASTQWKAEYFPNIDLEGDPGMKERLDTLSVNWGTGSPGEWFNPNWFSARFTRDLSLAAGAYQFSARAEGGVRLWVDGYPVIDQWHETDKTTYTGLVTVGAGSHQVEVNYMETHGNASIKVTWQPYVAKFTGWKGEYYATADLSGVPILVRDDQVIDFNWSDGAPATGLPSDFFSVRWTRSLYLSPAGYYRFTITADDGVRLWVDDKSLLDEWHRADSQTYYVDVYLAAGTHAVKLEYYDHTGYSSIRMTWQHANTTQTQAIVDDADAGFVRGGDESGWTRLSYGYGGHAWQASNQAGWWARWTPVLPKYAVYEVFAYIPWVRNATEKAVYYIQHGGAITTVTVNQRANAGRWVSLGTYGFNANGTDFVHLDGVTEEAAGSHNIAFDAVKFVYRQP